MQLEITVDRVEGAFAVLEVAGQTVDWPLSALPPGTAEGGRLRFEITGLPADANALAEARARLERLSRAGPQEDDIDL